MKKKGQLLGMPLVLLFSLIVGAMILLYGIKVAFDLTEEASYVDLADTLQDIEANIETFSQYDPGSSKVYSLDLPSQVDTICFYDTAGDTNCYLDGDVCSSEIQNSLSLMLEDSYNVYILPTGEFEQSRFFISSFSVDPANPVCISNGGSMLIQAEDGYVSIAHYES